MGPTEIGDPKTSTNDGVISIDGKAVNTQSPKSNRNTSDPGAAKPMQAARNYAPQAAMVGGLIVISGVAIASLNGEYSPDMDRDERDKKSI